MFLARLGLNGSGNLSRLMIGSDRRSGGMVDLEQNDRRGNKRVFDIGAVSGELLKRNKNMIRLCVICRKK